MIKEDWYEEAIQALRSELEEKKVIDGQEFLIDYHMDRMSSEEVEEYVTNTIVGFERYLSSEKSNWFRKGDGFNWFLFLEDASVDNSRAFDVDINFLNSDVTYESIEEYKRFFNNLKENDNSSKYLRIAIKKIACYYDKSEEISDSKKASYWFESGDICNDIESFEKAADYYRKSSSHTQSILSCERAINLGKEQKVSDSKLLYLVTLKKKQAEYIGDSSKYSKSFVEEGHIKRRMSKGMKKLWMCVYWVMSNYGESPSRVIFFALLSIFSTALIYNYLGVSTSELINGEVIDTCKSRGYFTSLYFSFVTFTTLGYGDFSPCQGAGRALSSTLAVAGLVFTSFAIATIVRKYSR